MNVFVALFFILNTANQLETQRCLDAAQGEMSFERGVQCVNTLLVSHQEEACQIAEKLHDIDSQRAIDAMENVEIDYCF